MQVTPYTHPRIDAQLQLGQAGAVGIKVGSYKNILGLFFWLMAQNVHRQQPAQQKECFTNLMA